MSIIGKVISLNYGIYKIIESILHDNRYVSLFNIKNRKILRHQNSIVKEQHIIDDKLFKEDSSFLPVVYDDGISFFSINKGIQEYCICYIDGILKLKHINSVEQKNYRFHIDNKIVNFNKHSGSKIFVAYHYNTSRIKSSIIEPIHVGRAISKEQMLNDIIGDNTGENISNLNKNYCELTAHYWAWKNTNYNIVGLMHYRRIFNLNTNNSKGTFKEFNNNMLNDFGLTEKSLDEIMKKYDILVPEIYNTHPAGFPNELMSNYEFYASEHIKEHWNIMESIILQNYSQYIPSLMYYKNLKKSFFFNMFIMKREYFNEYSEFLFEILNKVKEKISINSLNDYQQRFLGFLSERLLNIYIIHLKFFSQARIKHLKIIQKDESKSINYHVKDIVTKNKKYEKKSLSPIYIAFSCDNKYIRHCYTAINSLNKNTNYDFNIFIITSNLNTDNIKFIKKLECGHCKSIEIINIDASQFNIFPLNRKYISIATYYRLLLSNIIPCNIDKIIYLDCDIMVLGDIAELWDFNFPKHHYALVVEDEGGATQSQRLGLPIEKKYFNAGVIVFNLNRLRKENMLFKSRSILLKYQNKIRLQDQDILNIYFCGRVTYAPLSWNVGTRLYKKNDLKGTYSEYEWKEAILRPKIVHFTGNVKPWFLKSDHPLVNEYISYQYPKYRKRGKRFFYNLLKKIKYFFNYNAR